VLLLENIPLAPLTTIKIGGPARYFVEAKCIGEVQEAVTLARSRDLQLFVLGGGSNLVVARCRWPGCNLDDRDSKASTDATNPMKDGKVLFDVGAGESWDSFVSRAVMARCAASNA